MEAYLSANHFLPDINNELSERNATYVENFASLNALVLMLFDQDKTVVPKESAWFGSEAVPDNVQEDAQIAMSATTDKVIVPMRRQPLYLEDWIGLKALDERGAVILGTCNGEHMQLQRSCWEPVVKTWVGGLQ